MPHVHDPYLNTVKRTLEEENIKKRKSQTQVIDTVPEEKSKNNFFQRLLLNKDLYVPMYVQITLLINFIIFIPYLIGSILMFLFIDQEKLKEHLPFDVDSFVLSWLMGYQVIIFFVLLLILKTMFSHQKN